MNASLFLFLMLICCACWFHCGYCFGQSRGGERK